MASDLSNFLKDELTNTLEQLLSKSVSIDSLGEVDVNNLDDSQCVDVCIKFDFANVSSKWNFYIPTATATKFEYFMLGGMGALKEHIDDEITDAVNEIISNICGSLCTSVNAQGFPDVKSIKYESLGSSIKDCKDISSIERKYFFDLTLDGEKMSFLMSFDEPIVPYLSQIIGDVSSADNNDNIIPQASNNTNTPQAAPSFGISSLLSDESAQNLQLLFDIKLKLSVRLGTKVFLLKDILRWDIGEIIELEQMVNEPLEILVNGIKIGDGEAVIVEGKFGLKVKNIGNASSRLSQIGL